ncbi:MAG TPA: carboxylate--amine ligase, partial [Candidatus Ozemobacteraceae bacterium]|nr:carboxylate--amine ligase [Candidatus Ozemobacteraceae bacterium]
MNFLFLSPHFPPNFTCFSEQLNLAGFNVLGMGDAPWHELPDRLKWSLKEYCQIQNMEDYDQVYRATAYLISRFGRIDRVGSQNEHWLRLEARLRDDFSIPGMRPLE